MMFKLKIIYNHFLYLDEELISGAQIRNATRQSILNLLLQTLDQQAPNLAHFLLGFETRKPVAKTNLQDPGKFYISILRKSTLQQLKKN